MVSKSNSSRPFLAVLTIAAALLAVACAGAAAEDPASPADVSFPTSGPASTTESLPSALFASHIFVPVGARVDISDYGTLLGQIDFTSPSAITVSGDEVVAENGGISCLRFRYREAARENEVQTQCIVSFDETGSCSGHTALSLNLEQNAQPALIPDGSNSDLFESGQGLFYAACVTNNGRYRLQQSELDLPPLYFHIVDAYGDGPYSLGFSEFDLYRDGAIQTFSGDQLRPNWLNVFSGEINHLEFGPQGFEFTFDDCAYSPSCSVHPDVLQPGDIMMATWSAPLDRFAEIVEASGENGLAKWFTEATGVDLSSSREQHPSLESNAVMRLLSLDAMDGVLAWFDELYGVREKNVTVAYTPFWPTAEVTLSCHPDDRQICDETEQALQVVEAQRIGALKKAGYTLWFGGNADYDFEGNYRSWDFELRPHISLFDGYVPRISANQRVPKEQVPDVLATVMAGLASDIGSEKPVHLMTGGPPITGVTISEFCEADICTADFGPLYDQTEAWLISALASFAPGQIAGLSVSLFDGSHFDILEPYETIGGVQLNRAAETGYNNPVLNIYRAR